MIIISIDIETTGLDPDENFIIEFAAIYEDTSVTVPVNDLPYFRALVAEPLFHDGKWNEYALNLHKQSGLYDEWAHSEDAIPVEIVIHHFEDWLLENGFGYGSDGKIRINCAGKNFGSFDKQFLTKAGFDKNIRFSHKALDPAILFVDWENDIELPSLSECKKRAGLLETVSHKALDDAKDVIELLRKAYVR